MSNADTTITIDADTSQAERCMATLLRDDMQPSPTSVRVDAWLEAHREWIAASADRHKLRSQWRACAQWFGADSDPARGVLLGLVRLAWGESGLVTSEHQNGWGISSGAWQCVGLRWAIEVEALLAALEAAPCL